MLGFYFGLEVLSELATVLLCKPSKAVKRQGPALKECSAGFHVSLQEGKPHTASELSKQPRLVAYPALKNIQTMYRLEYLDRKREGEGERGMPNAKNVY